MCDLPCKYMETLVAPACAGRNLRNLQLWEWQEEACLTLCLDWRVLCIQVGLLTWLLALVTIQLALTHHAVWKVQPLHIHTSVSFLSSKSLSPQPFMQLRRTSCVDETPPNSVASAISNPLSRKKQGLQNQRFRAPCRMGHLRSSGAP